MEIKYGAQVIDRNGKVLGTISYIIRNSWTGEISKFMVSREALSKYLSFSPQDVLEATESKVRIGISSDELNKE